MTDEIKEELSVDQHVGKKLRERRTLLGLSQKTLAERLDITFQQIQKYESGKNSLNASRLFQTSLVLDNSVCYFFDGLEAIEPSEAERKLKFSPSVLGNRETLELLKSYYAIKNDTLKRRFRDLIHEIIESE